MADAYRKYLTKFRGRSTATLIKGYKRYNAQFRQIARSEFKKRRVPAKRLPYKKPVRRQSRGFSFF